MGARDRHGPSNQLNWVAEMENKFSISDLASEFQVTTRTIRFYEEKGLLTPVRRGSVRLYGPRERVKLKLILRGRRLGFSLDESRDIIEMYDPESENVKQLQSLLEKIHEKQGQLEAQKKEVNSMLKDLKIAEKNCLDAISHPG